MFKRRSAILILISAFLVGGGYLNSEAINTYFSYVTEKFDPEPVLEVYFSQTPEASPDPNFTTASITEPSSTSPPYYLIINTNSARDTTVSFSPFTAVPSSSASGSIPYTVSMHEFESKQSIGSCVISSTSDAIKMYGPNMTFGEPVRYVYSFIYKFEEADISNASPGTYESTVTVTVNGG